MTRRHGEPVHAWGSVWVTVSKIPCGLNAKRKLARLSAITRSGWRVMLGRA